MRTFKDFYENYWNWRKNKYDYRKKGIVPNRIDNAVKLILSDSNKKNVLNVLDVGCGEGILGEEIGKGTKNSVFVCGVDISDNALETAKAHYNENHQIDVDTNSISSLLNNRRFDYIVCLEMIEHIIYPENLLKEFPGLLKKDGKLIISVPNFVSFKNRLKILKGDFPYEQHIFHSAEHIHYFTYHSFKKLLNDNKFRVLSILDSDFTFLPIYSILPKNFQRKFLGKFPNFFGTQLVFYCEPDTKIY